jgi:hypothetical protein
MSLLLLSSLQAEDVKALYKNKCLVCHPTHVVQDKNKLLGPPADEIMVHVKEAYGDKMQAVNFMLDYILDPQVSKALCASMDKFGLIPSMQHRVSEDEARLISEMMYEKFPREDFQKKTKQSRENVSFEMIDTNKDGVISSKEFQIFRAKRNNIDPNSFKVDLYFQKVDLNKNGTMDKEEFKTMKHQKSGN